MKKKLSEWQRVCLDLFSIPFIFGRIIGIISEKALEYIKNSEE